MNEVEKQILKNQATIMLAVTDTGTFDNETLNSIKARGLYDESLIIVCSDHGEAFDEHGVFGHISTVYDEMIKIPFLIKLPFQKKAGTEKKYIH